MQWTGCRADMSSRQRQLRVALPAMQRVTSQYNARQGWTTLCTRCVNMPHLIRIRFAVSHCNQGPGAHAYAHAHAISHRHHCCWRKLIRTDAMHSAMQTSRRKAVTCWDPVLFSAEPPASRWHHYDLLYCSGSFQVVRQRSAASTCQPLQRGASSLLTSSR